MERCDICKVNYKKTCVKSHKKSYVHLINVGEYMKKNKGLINDRDAFIIHMITNNKHINF